VGHHHRNDASGKLMDGAFRSEAGFEGLDLSSAELARRVSALLSSGLHGLCFSAYLPGQSPQEHAQLSEAQVRERLRIIAPHTKWIRTFSCSEGNELAPALAHELGMKTLVGAWIDGDEARNEREIEAVIELARHGHCDLIAVGNEVLLRGELPEEAIIDAIRRVKEGAPGVPVGYVDAYFLFAQHPRLVQACDFLPINCYPFWEKCPLAQSFGYVQEMVRMVDNCAGGKPILIAETGWPTQGTAEGDADPGLDNAARYALNLIPWAQRAGVPLFWFAAFDEAWKVGAEGDCGAYWGFWDAEGQPKYVG
jgi:exo-beta-1,3-glucanase (GH17 family)